MLVLVASAWLAVAAQTPAEQNPHLATAIQQLRDLEEQQALATLEKAKAWPNNTPAELARIHLYSGLAYAGLANGSKAVTSFHDALLLDPKLALPDDASPRVREWWDQARRSEGLSPAAASASTVAPAPASLPSPAVTTPGPAAKPASWKRWAGPLLAGTAAAALAGGLYFGWRGRVDANSANSAGVPEIGDALALRAQAERSALAANVLYGGAVVLGGGAVLVLTGTF